MGETPYFSGTRTVFGIEPSDHLVKNSARKKMLIIFYNKLTSNAIAAMDMPMVVIQPMAFEIKPFTLFCIIF